MIKILYLTFHFAPELGPAATRNTAIVKSLEKRGTVSQIDVFTTTPNRWGMKISAIDDTDCSEKIKIFRHKTTFFWHNTLFQSFEFLLYANFVRKKIKNNNYNLVFASSSKMGTAVLGAMISQNKRVPFYLDVRDIFILSIEAYLKSRLFYPLKIILKKIYFYAISKANRINCVSPGFVKIMSQINAEAEISVIHHGIKQIHKDNGTPIKLETEKKYILYSGNIGLGQGLTSVVRRLAEILPSEFKLCIYGDGSEKNNIAQLTEKLDNVELHAPIHLHDLQSKYNDAELLILSLNPSSVFSSSIPSKLFDYLATDKPIFAFCSGATKKFVEQHKIPGVFFVDDFDQNNLLVAFRQCIGIRYDRGIFSELWDHSKQISKMTDDILTLFD